MTATEEQLDLLVSMMAQFGATPEQVAARAGSAASPLPTVAAFLPAVEKATMPASRRTYATYWRLLVSEYGACPLDKVESHSLKTLPLKAKEQAVRRANYRGGRSAQESCDSRAFFAVAVDDGLLATNPASTVPKPQRHESSRRALDATEVHDLYRVSGSGGDDLVLDVLLLRFDLETGARRCGALALRPCDLDQQRQCVRLREKGEKERWQPVSKTLMTSIVQHAEARGALHEDDAVFRRWQAVGGSERVAEPVINLSADGVKPMCHQTPPQIVSPEAGRHHIKRLRRRHKQSGIGGLCSRPLGVRSTDREGNQWHGRPRPQDVSAGPVRPATVCLTVSLLASPCLLALPPVPPRCPTLHWHPQLSQPVRWARRPYHRGTVPASLNTPKHLCGKLA